MLTHFDRSTIVASSHLSSTMGARCFDSRAWQVTKRPGNSYSRSKMADLRLCARQRLLCHSQASQASQASAGLTASKAISPFQQQPAQPSSAVSIQQDSAPATLQTGYPTHKWSWKGHSINYVVCVWTQALPAHFRFSQPMFVILFLHSETYLNSGLSPCRLLVVVNLSCWFMALVPALAITGKLYHGWHRTDSR